MCSKNALLPPAGQDELWTLLSMQTQHTLVEDESEQVYETLLRRLTLAAKLNNAGHVSADRGDYVQALEHLVKAYAIQEQILAPDHPDMAVTYENMGYTYGDLGNNKNALEYHTKALAIREKVLPAEHPDIAVSCHNIAWVYRDMGDYQRAREYLRRAVDIAEKALPEGHPERVKYRADLENLERDIRQ
jgi:tetratricopeptide (TPR) repeat protein